MELRNMTSRVVKRELEFEENEEHVEEEDSTNLIDCGPVVVKTENPLPSSEVKVKDEQVDDDEDNGRRRLRSQSQLKSKAKKCKVSIISKDKPEGVGGEPRRFASVEAHLKKIRERNRRRREKMSEEEREALRRKRKEAYQKKKAMKKFEDPDEIEEKKRKQREYNRKRITENPEKYQEQLRRVREANRRMKEENPEKYKEYQARWRNRKPPDPNKPKKPLTEEQIMSRRRSAQKWRDKQMQTPEGRQKQWFHQFSKSQMKLAQMTDEEIAALKTKRREDAQKWRDKLDEEKREKYRAYLRENSKKNYEKHLKNEGEAYRKVINSRYREYIASETPEQRQRRLRRYKINQAVNKLKKQLEEIEVPPEEVEKRAIELRREMEAEPLPPPETLSTYKPRVKSESEGDSSAPRPQPRERRRRRGRPRISSQTVSNCHSNSEASCDSQNHSQPGAGTGSTEMDDSNDFDFDDHGFQCEDEANDEINTDAATTEPELVPVVHFDFKCPHCPSTYSERSDLISHVGSEHSEKCWKCPKCKLVVLSPADLSEHFKTVHFPVSKGSTAIATARTAKSVSKTSKKKKTSLSLSDDDNTFTCIKCDPVKIRECDRTFVSVKDLMGHVKSCHPLSFWPCLKCNVLKYTKSSLKFHEKVCQPIGGGTIKPKPKGRKLRKRLAKK